MIEKLRPQQIIWATRGRIWGFQFLLRAGLPDPLGPYEAAFSGVRDEPEALAATGSTVALRFPDPLGRRDTAGRVIPHEFVMFGATIEQVPSVEHGISLVWPLVADMYSRVWDEPEPPSTAALLAQLA